MTKKIIQHPTASFVEIIPEMIAIKKWNEVLDNIIPILIKGAEIDPQTAKCGFVLTRDMWRNNEFIVYVVKRLAGKYEIDMEE